MFVHDIAGWLGIPAGVVIAVMIILRRKGKALHARRQQARAASRPPSGQPPDSALRSRLSTRT